MRFRVGETIALSVPQGADGAAVALLWGVTGDTLTAAAVDGVATFAATETANLLPGRYLVNWRLSGTEGVVRIVEAPAIVLLASLDDGIPPQPTDAERRLDAAEKLLETAAGSAELSMSTADGTSLTFETRADLLAFVARLRDEVGVERAVSRLGAANE